MPKKNSHITVTDQFCGAGGSSQGVRILSRRYKGGLEVKLALNHWKLAIETHQTNFPDTDHDCTDVSACDPRRYPSTDILITSPECTTHSPAGGNNHKTLKKQMDLFNTQKIDPATERSRATMWDVCRFAEYHEYNAIIVENVVEAKTRWALFDVWLMAMHKLGYDHRCVYLNSMHCHPTPQSRDRMYVVFWKKGNKAPMLDYMPLAYCPRCETNVNAVQTWKQPDKKYGKYKQQYVYCCSSCTTVVDPYYYASFNCIDWSDRGTRIGDRKKSLSPNTIKRIEFGRDKYWNQPLVVTTKYHSEPHQYGARNIGDELRTQTSEQAHAIFNPLLVNTLNGGNAKHRSRSVLESSIAQTTYNGTILVNQPFVIKTENGSNLDSANGIAETNRTQTCRQTSAVVVPPFLINDQHSTGIDFRVKSSTDRLATIPTTPQVKLVTPPYIVNHNHSSKADPINNALGTQPCSERYSLLLPPFLTESCSNGKAREITDVLNTATAGGVKTGLVTSESWNSFLAYNYNGFQTSHISEAADTIPCKDRISVINYQTPAIEDCFYRMLKPPEIKVGMAFDPTYIILGSSKDQVRQCGNAVTPPAMEWLVQQVVESLK